MFDLDVPLTNVRSARRSSMRPLAWGVHTTGDTWLVNGSRHGIVELNFSRPVSSKSVRRLSFSSGEVRCLYLSLEDPDGFIAAMTAHP